MALIKVMPSLPEEKNLIGSNHYEAIVQLWNVQPEQEPDTTNLPMLYWRQWNKEAQGERLN